MTRYRIGASTRFANARVRLLFLVLIKSRFYVWVQYSVKQAIRFGVNFEGCMRFEWRYLYCYEKLLGPFQLVAVHYHFIGIKVHGKVEVLSQAAKFSLESKWKTIKKNRWLQLKQLSSVLNYAWNFKGEQQNGFTQLEIMQAICFWFIRPASNSTRSHRSRRFSVEQEDTGG